MYLKEIEMQGFKSFANKTKILFDKGVTAVVGPNGSGKSNITESLRWALGESSAKSLRGGKMPDVIFAGTESRQPLNYAQVAVTLDNSDAFLKGVGETVRVERHIYRNGDSDYLIDGRKVRLRDIHDLFMDTGLGRDSFSIISQGRVEAIFNSKPEERRAIFEEAAGVLKYKTRKKETESKLNQTQDNLDRLEDIIYELETQITPLEKQAKTAQQFLSLDNERKQLHLAILVADILADKERLSEVTGQLDTVKSDLAAYYERREKLESQNQSLKQKRHRLSESISAKQDSLLQVTQLLSDLDRQLDLLQLASTQQEEKKASAHQELVQLTGQKEKLEQELRDKDKAMLALSEELTQTDQEIASLEKDLARFATSPEELIESLREQFVALMHEEAELSNQLTVISADRETEEQLNASKIIELKETAASLEKTKESTAKALETANQAKAYVSKLLSDYNDLSRAIATDEGLYQSAQTELFDHLDKLKSKQARQSSLMTILKNHSQFYAGVKSVLQASSELGGVIGAVSEHLSFDKNYQTALEIALGGSSQHIIVADEQAAKRCIAFLKKNRQGRATFLPLTTIKPRHLSPQNQTRLSACNGFLGLASDLIRVDTELSHIYQNLLGVTAIFDTVDHANQAAKQLHYQVRLISLDGTEIRPGGAFSGGASRQNNSTFIKPELDQLTQELVLLEKEQITKETAVRKIQEQLATQKATLSDLQTAGEQARLEEQKARLEYERLAEHLDDLTKVYQGLQTISSDDSTSTLATQQDQLTQQLADLDKRKQALLSEIDQIKENKTTLDQKVSNLRDSLSQAQIRERELQSELKFEAANQKRLKQSCANLEEDMRRCEAYLKTTAEQEVDKLPQLQAQREAALEQKQRDEENLVRLRFELEDCEDSLEETEQILQKEQTENEVLIRKQAQQEAQKSQLTTKLHQSANLLSEEYQMSFEEANNNATPLENLALARETLQSLQGSIKSLGTINLDAIAQYEQVNERLTFLNGQKDDLVRAKNLLLDTITDMDDEVKSRFQVTFEAIRDSFKQTFKQMFGGGSADLTLTDGDLLSAGIVISVQPPGKKIQSLNLMSGGEKALSALALLFAIIRVKTIPFVILDEVEAALDEANVKRFGDYLNRFDKSSQFIVVTHRKGTMAAADSIYGVTMQESGVSRIVSVKLKEAEKLIH